MTSEQSPQGIFNPLDTAGQLQLLSKKLLEHGFEYYVYIQNLPFFFNDSELRFLCASNLPHSSLKNLQDGILLKDNPLEHLNLAAHSHYNAFTWHRNSLSNHPDLIKLFHEFPQLYGLNMPYRNTTSGEKSALVLLRSNHPFTENEIQHHLSEQKLLIISARNLIRQHLVNHYLKTMYPGLSSRQMQISRCIASGMTNNDIAELLHITNDTVKYHITQILDKTNSSCRTTAAFKALLPELIN